MQDQLESIVLSVGSADSAHDLGHSRRVYRNCLRLSETEGGSREIFLAASYLHDIANYPKSDPRSHLSSERSAGRASEIMRGLGMAAEHLEALEDAILCHSYSRGLPPKTLEGRVFQDADRLDALGAIGIARAFAVTGSMGRSFYHPVDPFFRMSRDLNDREYAVDHFYRKLFTLEKTMQTEAGRNVAREWTERQRVFLSWLESEIS